MGALFKASWRSLGSQVVQRGSTPLPSLLFWQEEEDEEEEEEEEGKEEGGK